LTVSRFREECVTGDDFRRAMDRLRLCGLEKEIFILRFRKGLTLEQVCTTFAMRGYGIRSYGRVSHISSGVTRKIGKMPDDFFRRR